jgi:hypothetical protein
MVWRGRAGGGWTIRPTTANSNDRDGGDGTGSAAQTPRESTLVNRGGEERGEGRTVTARDVWLHDCNAHAWGGRVLRTT